MMLINRAQVSTTTTGTGTITLGVATTGYQTFADAGAINGDTYSYLIKEGDAWEIGHGVYSSSGPTLTRPGPGVDAAFQSNTGALLNLSGSAIVSCSLLSEDVGGSISVSDGITTESGVTNLVFSGASVSSTGPGEATVNITGGGGGGGALTLISQQSLSVDTPTVTFDSIPGGYRDLVLMMSSTGTVSGSPGDEFINCKFNSDSSSSYSWSRWSRFETDQGLNQTPGNIGSNISTDATGELWPTQVELFDYSNTATNKHWQSRTSLFGGGNFSPRLIDGFWSNHTAITRIDLFMAGQSFKAGSSFNLYGRS